MPLLLKKRPRTGAVLLPSYSVGGISDSPAEIRGRTGIDSVSRSHMAGQRVDAEEKKVTAALFEDELPQMSRGNNPQNDGARTRRDLKVYTKKKKKIRVQLTLELCRSTHTWIFQLICAVLTRVVQRSSS